MELRSDPMGLSTLPASSIAAPRSTAVQMRAGRPSGCFGSVPVRVVFFARAGRPHRCGLFRSVALKEANPSACLFARLIYHSGFPRILHHSQVFELAPSKSGRASAGSRYSINFTKQRVTESLRALGRTPRDGARASASRFKMARKPFARKLFPLATPTPLNDCQTITDFAPPDGFPST
jgi:hypothetical protein